MKITTLQPPALGRRPDGPGAPAASAAARPRASVQTALSPLSASLQQVNADLPREAPLDQARVADIRQALRDGRLRLDPARIADALLAQGEALAGDRR